MNSTEIERIFYSDSREKKRIGSNVSKRALRRGGIRGGIKTPSDFLTAKQKKELNGEVRVTNMYEKYKDINNCDIEELRKLPKGAERIAIFKFIKENHSRETLMEKWNATKGNISNIFTREITNVNSKYSNKFKYEDIKALGVYAIENDNVLSFEAYRLKKDKDKAMLIKRYAEKYPVVCINMLMGVSKATIIKEIKDRVGEYKLNIMSAWNMVEAIKQKYDYEKIDEILKGNKIDIERFDPKNRNTIKNEMNKEIRAVKEKEVVKEEVAAVEKIKITEEEEQINMNTNVDNKELEELQGKYNNLLLEVRELKENIIKLKETKDTGNTGISFNLKGDYNKEEVEKRLVSTSYILQDDYIYNIDLKITEIAKVETEKVETEKVEVNEEPITKTHAIFDRF